MLIYIVTEGYDDDYHIIAVFDKREYAEEILNDERDIEEFWLNPTVVGDERYSAFRVEMKKNGESYVADGQIQNASREPAAFIAARSGAPYATLVYHIMARDAEHAAFLVNEQRELLLERWPDIVWQGGPNLQGKNGLVWMIPVEEA